MLTYGGGSIKKSGLYQRVIKALEGLEVTELPGIAPNPKIDSVREGQRLTQKLNTDVILAVGGGSVIDASKVIGSAYFYQGDPWDLVVDAKKRNSLDQLPVVDILTIAATGTETNNAAVISNPDLNKKIGTFGPKTPAVSFLDPTQTFTVSKYQTAAGSIDIFSHLTEQYFDRAMTEPMDNMIEGLMRAVIKYAPIAIAEPENYDARGSLMISVTMALNGLFRSGRENSWTCHSIEHELSAFYDITHGVGLGILTPCWMKKVFEDPSTHAKMAKAGRNVWNIQGDSDTEVASKTIQAVYDWVKSLGVPTTLPDVGINSAEHFEEMATSAVNQANLSEKAYVKLSPDDVVKLYQASMSTNGFE